MPPAIEISSLAQNVTCLWHVDLPGGGQVIVDGNGPIYPVDGLDILEFNG